MGFSVSMARPEEYEELISFADRVFGLSFSNLLPNLYDSRPEKARCHYLIREPEGIRALVGAFPVPLMVGGTRLQNIGIGTVSVAPEARGRGYMKLLVGKAVQDAREAGADLMVLCGLRKRYEYFGFTPCATKMELDCSQDLLRHLEIPARQRVALVPLAGGEYLEQCRALYEKQPVYALRQKADFEATVGNHNCKPYLFLQEGTFAGYCGLSVEHGRVQELLLNDPALAAGAVRAVLEATGRQTTFELCFWQRALLVELNQIYDWGGVRTAPQFNVLNYPRVVRAFLALKAQNWPLPDCSYVFDVQAVGRYEIQVRGGAVTVEETDAPFDVSLPHLLMMQHLFSPVSVYTRGSANPAETALLPIPISLPPADEV